MTKAIVDAAKRRIKQVGQTAIEKEMSRREPHLYGALCFISNVPFADFPETLSEETQSQIHSTIWRAALVAIDKGRIDRLGEA